MDSSHHDVVAGDTFPVKLHKLLHAAEQNGKTDLISWLPDGQKFKVHDKERFAAELMPHYFASCTYKSFQRSKNLWGFQTISKGVHKGECSHPLFVRGNVNLCRKMTRVRTKSDDSGDAEHTPPVSTDVVSNGEGSSISGLQLGANLLSQSSLNPSILLGGQQWQQQQQQQQQQLASINQLLNAGAFGNQPSSNLSTNRLLSVLSSLSSGNSNSTAPGTLLSGRLQAPPPVPVQPMQNQVNALQQLLQLASQPHQQPSTPTSSLSQIMALIALQQQQQQHQQTTNSGVGDLSMLSAATSMLLPLAPVATTAPSFTPPVHTTTTAGGGKKNVTDTGKSSKKGGDLPSQQEKTNGQREAALQRGSKVVACRARGMALDHNIHVRNA
jgi:hypothetical protein